MMKCPKCGTEKDLSKFETVDMETGNTLLNSACDLCRARIETDRYCIECDAWKPADQYNVRNDCCDACWYLATEGREHDDDSPVEFKPAFDVDAKKEDGMKGSICECEPKCEGSGDVVCWKKYGESHLPKKTCIKCQKEMIFKDRYFDTCTVCWNKDHALMNHYGGGTQFHTHKPHEFIASPKYKIYAATKSWVHADEFDLIVNCSGFGMVPREHEFPVGYESLSNYVDGDIANEIMLDWPDQDAAPLKAGFWTHLVELLEAREKGTYKVAICCTGGHGRTGTAIACLLVAACGFEGQQAIDHVRQAYCVEAIESTVQEAYILEVAQALQPASNNSAKLSKVKKGKEKK